VVRTRAGARRKLTVEAVPSFNALKKFCGIWVQDCDQQGLFHRNVIDEGLSRRDSRIATALSRCLGPSNVAGASLAKGQNGSIRAIASSAMIQRGEVICDSEQDLHWLAFSRNAPSIRSPRGWYIFKANAHQFGSTALSFLVPALTGIKHDKRVSLRGNSGRIGSRFNGHSLGSRRPIYFLARRARLCTQKSR
jgi:hypothetical protein